MQQRYGRGLVSFCEQKDINVKIATKAFIKEYDLNPEEHFQKFANFCDKEIKAGRLKGLAISLNKEMYAQQQKEKEAYRTLMNSYSKEEKQFWNKIKSESPHFETLNKFFALHGMNLPKKNKDASTKLGENLPRYEVLINNGLLNEFLSYGK